MPHIEMRPIGFVRNDVKDKKDYSWGEELSTIVLDESYRHGLTGLADFSHAIILTYLDKARYEPQKHLQRRPQNRADMPPSLPSGPRTGPTPSDSQRWRSSPQMNSH